MNLADYATDLLFPAPPPTYTEETPGFVNVGKGCRIAAFTVNLERARQTIVHCPGNGEDAHEVAELMREMLPHGYGMIIPAYAGYGFSDGAKSEEGCVAAAKAAYDWLIEAKGFDSWDIVISGFSLGSGVAVRLAAQVKAKGVVLFAPFLNGRSMIIHWIGANDAKEVLGEAEMFPSDKIISSVKKPVIVVHGNRDEVIPTEAGRKLFLRAGAPLAWHAINAGHNDLLSRFGTFGWTTVLGQIEHQSTTRHVAGEVTVLEMIQWKPLRVLREIGRRLGLQDVATMRHEDLISAICREVLNSDVEALAKRDFVAMGGEEFSALMTAVREEAVEIDSKKVARHLEGCPFIDVRKNKYGGHTVRLPAEIRAELKVRQDEWHRERFVIDEYVHGAVALYGVVTFGEVFDMIHRYWSTDQKLLPDEYVRMMIEARARDRFPYFVRNEYICGSEFDVGPKSSDAIAEFLARRDLVDRWIPSSASELSYCAGDSYYLQSDQANALVDWLGEHGVEGMNSCIHHLEEWLTYVAQWFQTGERLDKIARRLISICPQKPDANAVKKLRELLVDFVGNLRLRINNGWTLKELSSLNGSVLRKVCGDTTCELSCDSNLKCQGRMNKTKLDLRRPIG